MGLYNLLFGQNYLAGFLVSTLQIDLKKNPGLRFRDIFLNKDGTKILMFTRNGGANRKHYGEYQNDDFKGTRKEGPECTCHGCAISEHLIKHPQYLSDYDDPYDNTYATVEFSVSIDDQNITGKIASGQDPEPIGAKFKIALEKLENGDEEIIAKLSPMMEKLKREIEKMDSKN